MITEDTLFIIGAGASAPYGYPTGYELRRLIIKEFPQRAGDHEFIKSPMVVEDDELARASTSKIREAKQLSADFERSRTPSIDLFLSRRRQFDRIGRRAIAQLIFEKERVSKFEFDMDDINEDWYSFLYHRMTETLIDPERYMEFSENKVSFITFNYDRSLEHFLYDALINSFNIPLQRIETKDLFPFEFIPVYGKLEKLPWQDTTGVEYRSYFIPKMIGNIKIIYDNEIDTSLKEAITKEIEKAKRIFFLGFGYADENLKILDIPNLLQRDQKVYGTAKGRTRKQINKLKSIFEYCEDGYGVHTNNIEIHDFDCVKLLTEYL